MPRNTNGLYTLPAKNPVSPGTLIESDWANTTMTDIALALTNSLDRYGSGGMIAAFLVADGTVTAPGVAFASQPSTGMWKPSQGVLAFSLAGSEILNFSAGLAQSKLPTSVMAQTGGDNARFGVGSSAFANAAAGRGLIEVNGTGETLLALLVGGAMKSFLQTTPGVTNLFTTTSAPVVLGTNNAARMSVADDSVSFNVPPIWATAPAAPSHLANKAYVDSTVGGAGYLPISGGTLTAPGNLNVTNLGVSAALGVTGPATFNGASTFNATATFAAPPVSAVAPSAASHLANKAYVDTFVAGSGFVLRSGDTMTGALVISTGGIAPLSLDTTVGGGPFMSFNMNGAAQGWVGSNTLFVDGAAGDFGIRSQGALVFAGDGGAPMMRIDAAGNVGIGLTAPIAKLHVSGGGVRADLGGVSGTSLVLTGGNANLQVQHVVASGIITLLNSAGDGPNIAFAGSGGEFMRIDGAGHIGLGMVPQVWWSSRRAISVTAQGGIPTSFVGSADGTSEIWSNLYLDAAAAIRYSRAGPGVIYQQNSGGSGVSTWLLAGAGAAGAVATTKEAMRINAQGNVGIGTTAPNGPLHLVTVADSLVRLGVTAEENIAEFRLLGNNSTAALRIWMLQATSGDIIFGTGNQERARISSGGVFTYGGLEVGYRKIPQAGNASTGATQLAIGDRGKAHYKNSGNVDIPGGVFSGGDVVTIVNYGDTTLDLTVSAGLVMFLSGTALQGGPRKLAQRGVATVFFCGTSDAIISGSGLS